MVCLDALGKILPALESLSKDAGPEELLEGLFSAIGGQLLNKDYLVMTKALEVLSFPHSLLL